MNAHEPCWSQSAPLNHKLRHPPVDAKMRRGGCYLFVDQCHS